MKKSLFGALLLAAPLTLNAGQLNVEYSKFYSHLKKIDKEETANLQFSFGFIHNVRKELCQIESAMLVTQKKDIKVEVNAEQRFTLPIEKALKLANALVAVDIVEPNNQCDMSVQLETVPALLAQTQTPDNLRLILEQYDAFFDTMGSFLSFLMPGVEGLIIWLPENQSYDHLSASGVSVEGSRVVLSKDWIEDNKENFVLPAKPIRITSVVN